MLKDLTKTQRNHCEKCCYRDRILDKIVFCPYVNNCRHTGRPAEYLIEKGNDKDDGDYTESVRRHNK